jgi:hypothetical protein
MASYITFFVAQLLLIWLVRNRWPAFARSLVLVFAALSAAVAGLRADVGTDTFVYRAYYESVGEGNPLFDYEPGLLALSLVGNWLGFGSQFLLIAVATVQFLSLAAIVLIVAEPDILYLLVLSRFFVHLDMNIIRNGMAAHLAGLAIALFLIKRSKTSFLLSAMAVSVHWSALCVPILLLPILSISAGIAFVPLIMSNGEIFGRLATAVGTPTLQFPGFGLTVIYAMLALCLVIERQRSSSITMTLYVLSAICTLFSSSSLFFERIGIYFEFGLFVSLLATNVKSPITPRLLAVICGIFAYRSLMFVANSDAAMAELISNQPGMAQLYQQTNWVPYRFFWQQH